MILAGSFRKVSMTGESAFMMLCAAALATPVSRQLGSKGLQRVGNVAPVRVPPAPTSLPLGCAEVCETSLVVSDGVPGWGKRMRHPTKTPAPKSKSSRTTRQSERVCVGNIRNLLFFRSHAILPMAKEGYGGIALEISKKGKKRILW